ncbi:MAG: hypothetical protein KY456_10985 [Chloroflexi bacterium]|nr:hypothetical protein [Chloroflexota bacterium]
MDGSAERGRARDEGTRPPDRKGPTQQRGEPGSAPGVGAPSGRTPQDSRRRRGSDQRYAGWGDGIERVYCSRAAHFLPATFPVESHSGAATIAAAIVARRPDILLLCAFSHHGPHAWPNGEIVEDGPAMTTITGEKP